MSTLRISAAQLDSVARLQDEAAVLPILRRARLSRNLAFLAAIVQSGGAEGERNPAFRKLIEVQRHDRAVARRLIGHPRFGAWAAACADAPGKGAPSTAHLAAFAAAAAIRAGVPADLEVPTVDGVLVLPTLGALGGTRAPAVRVRTRRGANPFAGTPGWRRLRTLEGPGFSFEFDEHPLITAGSATDFPPPAQVGAAEFTRWRLTFVRAMTLLAELVPGLAGGLCEGMVTILPIRAVGSGTHAATVADAFGAASMTLPPDETEAAQTLVHEFQHSKLSALSELVPLIADDASDLYSPWREDPRPASAVLHGAFAHLAVARVWTRLALRQGARSSAAQWAEAESARERTRAACRVLAESGRLTEAGGRFVDLLDRTARDWSRAPTVSMRVAAARLDEHRADWVRRHQRDPATACPGARPPRV